MLKKVRIKNFLSCEDTEIEFDNITALIGRNAAGKTNILRIIHWIASFIVEDKRFYTSLHREAEVEINFLINDKEFKYILKTSQREVIIEELLCSDKVIAKRAGKKAFYADREFHISEFTSVIKAIVTFFPESEINSIIRNTINYLTGVKHYILEDKSQEYSIVSNDEYLMWLSNIANIDSSVTMRLLHSWKEKRDVFDELGEILSNNGLSLIDHIIISDSLSNDNITIYSIFFKVNGATVPYSSLSHGTQRVLLLLLALLYDKNSTLMIEQPEDGIHLGLLRKVLSICFTYAEAYNKQLIISTHSPKVINMFPAKSIRFVKMTEQGTKVTQLSEKELAVIPEYLNNEGTLADFIEAMDDE